MYIVHIIIYIYIIYVYYLYVALLSQWYPMVTIYGKSEPLEFPLHVFGSAPPWAVSCVSPLELEGQSGLWHPRASRWSPRACKETSGDIGDLGNGRNVIGNLWGYQRKLEKSIWESLEIHGNSQTIATGPYQPNMGGILFKKVP